MILNLVVAQSDPKTRVTSYVFYEPMESFRVCVDFTPIDIRVYIVHFPHDSPSARKHLSGLSRDPQQKMARAMAGALVSRWMETDQGRLFRRGYWTRVNAPPDPRAEHVVLVPTPFAPFTNSHAD